MGAINDVIYSKFYIQSHVGLNLFSQIKEAETSKEAINVYFDTLSLFAKTFKNNTVILSEGVQL